MSAARAAARSVTSAREPTGRTGGTVRMMRATAVAGTEMTTIVRGGVAEGVTVTMRKTSVAPVAGGIETMRTGTTVASAIGMTIGDVEMTVGTTLDEEIGTISTTEEGIDTTIETDAIGTATVMGVPDAAGGTGEVGVVVAMEAVA